MRKEISLLIAIIFFGIGNINAQNPDTFFSDNKNAEYVYQEGYQFMEYKGIAKIKKIEGNIIFFDVVCYKEGDDLKNKKNPQKKELQVKYENGEYKYLKEAGNWSRKGSIFRNAFECGAEDGWVWLHLKGETYFSTNRNTEFIYEAGAMDIGAKGTAKVASIKDSTITLDITYYAMGPDFFNKKNAKTQQMVLNFKNREYLYKTSKVQAKGKVYKWSLTLNYDDEYGGWINIKLPKKKERKIVTIKYLNNLGSASIYYNNKIVKSYDNWRKSWHSITRISCDTKNKFLFYDKQAGQAEIYNIDPQGNMTQIKAFNGFRKTWSKISWINNGNCNGLIKFEQADGYWEKYKCDDNGGISLQSKK